MTRLKYILLSLFILLLLFSFWETCNSQTVLSRRGAAGEISYTTVYDTVGADNRDGYSLDTDEDLHYSTEVYSYVGFDASGYEDTGYEFQLAIAQGKTIDSCFVRVYYTGTKFGTVAAGDSLEWRAFDVDNAAVFDATHTHALSSHATLVSTAIKHLPASAGAGWWESPNLASILQTVVNRAGWASGQYAGFVLQASGTWSDNADFRVADFGDTAHIAHIRVTYH